MEVLKKKIEENREAIVRDLDLSKELLGLLSKTEILNITDCVKLQQENDRSARNQLFLDMVVGRKDDTLYMRLIDCLQKCKQTRLANRLIDVSEEMNILNQMQQHLDLQLQQMSEFLSTEERRAGIYLTEPPSEDDDGNPALTETEIWSKVQVNIKQSQQLLMRCQSVIQKLHQDCETVAKQNSDIIQHTKDCDAKIKEVLSVGRKSAKQVTVPKRTQDLFANLMDDIEKLVKTRKRVINMETEGRRHSTRIVRQCRDWLESRSVVLQKLNTLPNPAALKHLEFSSDGELAVHVQRAAPPPNDNAIMSILDSLQLLEQELQAYIHHEISITDKYRLEVRRKQLLKKAHGFSLSGMTDIETALNNIEQDPQSLKDNVAVLRTHVGEINKEYGECVAYLSKVEAHLNPNTDNAVNISSPKTSRTEPAGHTPRNWPGNLKKKGTNGSKSSRGAEKGQNYVGAHGKDRNEPNQLLNQVKSFVEQFEELKHEDHDLSMKYRAEMSKRKRDMDIVLQRKEDQIMKLKSQLRETDAEKDKYKKLYNDTKIGYQRNVDAVYSPI